MQKEVPDKIRDAKEFDSVKIGRQKHANYRQQKDNANEKRMYRIVDTAA